MASKMKDGLVKRGNSWSYVVRVPDPATGKTKPQWKGGFATKKEAKEARAKAMAAIADGAHVDPSRLTVAEFLRDRWLPAMEATGKKGTTLRSYRSLSETHIIPRIGGVRIQALAPDMLNKLYAELLANGRSDGRGPLSAASVRRVHGVLSKALSDAEKWQLVVRNVAKAADPPRQPRPGENEMATWTAAELGQFLAETADDDLAPLWHVFAHTGLRRGEALGLRWSDLDLDAGRASIRQALTAVGYDLTFAPPKTPRSRRSVALDSETVSVLRSHRKRRLEARMRWGAAWHDESGDLVFTKENGEPLHPDYVSKRFAKLVEASELPRIRLHDLRHTWATLGLQAGVPVRVVADMLGHSTPAFTMSVYQHSIPALEEEAAETVARLVSGA